MPTESTLDRFIETSSSLLLAYPTTATLSVTYANSAKKNKRVSVKDGELKRATNKVTFKCYEARSGKCTKYSTHKVKELSRLLMFAGPRGVLVTTATKTSGDRPAGNLQDTATATTHKAGLASIMSNVKFEEDNVAAPKAEPSTTAEVESKGAAASATDAAASTPKNKKKKKKGKK